MEAFCTGDQRRSMGNMNIHFHQVTQSDTNKFPVWYERIGGPDLFSNFIPSTFLSFEESKDLLWFIILDDDDEIGTIWFERKDPDMASYDFGIYLNRIDLFGKGEKQRGQVFILHRYINMIFYKHIIL